MSISKDSRCQTCDRLIPGDPQVRELHFMRHDIQRLTVAVEIVGKLLRGRVIIEQRQEEKKPKSLGEGS